MEQFKIDLFKNEYNKAFPSYSKLSESECDIFRQAISIKYSINETNNSIDFLNDLISKQDLVESFDATEDFNLKKLLDYLELDYSPEIFVNWHQFDDIDRFKLNDLDKYFDDIWFASSDDIDLFDKNLTWIISIRHDGAIYKVVKSNG